MPGSKGLSPHELAHRWVKDLLASKSGAFDPDIILFDNFLLLKYYRKADRNNFYHICIYYL